MKDNQWKVIQTALLSVIAVCAVIVTVRVCTMKIECPKTDASNQTAATANVTPTATTTTPTTRPTKAPPFSTDTHLLIETPYGDLYYPKMYEACLHTQAVQENEAYKMRFSYRDGQEETLLFTVCFGDDTFGQHIGTIEDGVPFNVQMSDAVREDWTAEELVIVGGMREAINDVLQSAEAMQGYVPM